jgi:hypothetical protein
VIVDKEDMPAGDVMRCYRFMEEAGWELDKVTTIDLVMCSQSWTAAYMVTGWFNLIEGRPDRSRAYLAKAEAWCATEEELAYVLHVESKASLRMGDIGTALEKEQDCLAICRRTRDRYLVARVLVQLGMIVSVFNRNAEKDRDLEKENQLTGEQSIG